MVPPFNKYFIIDPSLVLFAHGDRDARRKAIVYVTVVASCPMCPTYVQPSSFGSPSRSSWKQHSLLDFRSFFFLKISKEISTKSLEQAIFTSRVRNSNKSWPNSWCKWTKRFHSGYIFIGLGKLFKLNTQLNSNNVFQYVDSPFVRRYLRKLLYVRPVGNLKRRDRIVDTMLSWNLKYLWNFQTCLTTYEATFTRAILICDFPFPRSYWTRTSNITML